MAVSTCSSVLVTSSASLSSSTTIASTEIAGRELDLVQRVQVGRVRNRDEQPLAALDQRQHAVLAQQLLADQPDDLQVGLDRVQVQERDAKLLGARDGDFARVGQVVLDQVADDRDPPLPGGGDRRQHVALADQPVRDQALGQALQGLAEGAWWRRRNRSRQG